MGYKAQLSNGIIIQPPVDVLANRITPQQANKEYRGVTGDCPHCLKLQGLQAGTDNATMLAALSHIDLTVGYRSAHIVDGYMKRTMCFAHRPNPLLSQMMCRLCADAKLAHHAMVLEVIGEWASKQWSNCRVEIELSIRLDGAPPETFSPDICGYDRNTNAPVFCIEYQRTYESFHKFQRRHEVRHKEFPSVLWYFDAPVYTKSREHRLFLYGRDEEFRKCWSDKNTGQLHGEIGMPPARVADSQVRPMLNDCSEAAAIRAKEMLERSKESLNYRAPLDPNLPFIATGRYVKRGTTVLDLIEVAKTRGYRSLNHIHTFLRGSGIDIHISQLKDLMNPPRHVMPEGAQLQLF